MFFVVTAAFISECWHMEIFTETRGSGIEVLTYIYESPCILCCINYARTESPLSSLAVAKESSGEARLEKRHSPAAEDFILRLRLLRFARKSYHERFIEAILAPVFRRASPQSRLAWQDLRSYAPSQIRPLRCV